MAVRITKTAVEQLAPGAALWDADLPGFGVRRQTSVRSYLVKYRHRGEQRLLTIGRHGPLTPEEARKRAKIYLGQVADGIDPAAVLAARRAPSRGDFAEMVGKFIALQVKPNNRTWSETERIFAKYVTPEWQDRSPGEVKRRDVAELLDGIEQNNGPVMADCVLAAVRMFFNWIAARDDEFRSPIVKGMARTKPRERARARVLSDPEIRALWQVTRRTKPTYFGAFVRVLLLSAQRRNEVARMRRTEVDPAGVWVIPPERYKTNVANIVPLPQAARDLIDAQPRMGKSDWIFTSTGDAPLAGFSKAKRALDADLLAVLRKDNPEAALPRWTLHDLRRTGKTLMARAGVRPDISERVLGHVISGVEGTYDRHHYTAEKRDALERLATVIQGIISPEPGKVVPIRQL